MRALVREMILRVAHKADGIRYYDGAVRLNVCSVLSYALKKLSLAIFYLMTFLVTGIAFGVIGYHLIPNSELLGGTMFGDGMFQAQQFLRDSREVSGYGWGFIAHMYALNLIPAIVFGAWLAFYQRVIKTIIFEMNLSEDESLKLSDYHEFVDYLKNGGEITKSFFRQFFLDACSDYGTIDVRQGVARIRLTGMITYLVGAAIIYMFVLFCVAIVGFVSAGVLSLFASFVYPDLYTVVDGNYFGEGLAAVKNIFTHNELNGVGLFKFFGLMFVQVIPLLVLFVAGVFIKHFICDNFDLSFRVSREEMLKLNNGAF